MRAHWRFSVLAAAGLIWLVPSQSVESIRSGPYFERFKAGDTVTDQSAGAPGSYSTLVGFQENVSDADFAAKVAAPALAAKASLYLVFNQCFSGGLIDDVAKLGGTQSIFTAARHSETASYGLPAPSGVDLDATDTFLLALADGRVPAVAVAEEAVALNPFGPNPDAKRISEPLGGEHAQYLAIGGGEQLRPADHADKGIAVLWAGQPAARDGQQMKLMIDRLVGMGFKPDRIWLMYGGGTVVAGHPVAEAYLARTEHPIHLQAATPENLFAVFANAFSKTNASHPDFVFLYVGDHGGLDSRSVAKTGFTPDLLVAPNFSIKPGMTIYGEG